jgi:microcystin-dependent protein
VFASLKNVTTADGYTAATTLRLPQAERIVLQVANAAVLYQLDTDPGGKGSWSEERFLAPTVGSLDRRCNGIRFRSAIAGAPAQVSCELLDADELSGGADALSGFTEFVSASGAVGGTLSLRTGDVFWSTTAAAREGALLCDGALYDAVADPTLENLWNKIGTTFGGTGKSSFAVPDLGGRVAVSVGIHADVNGIGEDEGAAAADRRPKHRHTASVGTDNVTGFSSNITRQALNAPTATPVTVGPAGAPLDAPAYLVLAAFIVK